jgi:hypothetical protein
MKQEQKKKAVKAMLSIALPVLAVIVAWLFAIVIVSMGIGFSLYYNNWDIFARSGSLIVVCALLLALFDYTSSSKKFFDQLKEAFGPEYQQDEVERIRQFVREEFKKYGLTKTDDEIAYIADRERESYWKGVITRFSGALKMRSVTSEVSLAIIGTLICGFGDLFG